MVVAAQKTDWWIRSAEKYRVEHYSFLSSRNCFFGGTRGTRKVDGVSRRRVKQLNHYISRVKNNRAYTVGFMTHAIFYIGQNAILDYSNLQRSEFERKMEIAHVHSRIQRTVIAN